MRRIKTPCHLRELGVLVSLVNDGLRRRIETVHAAIRSVREPQTGPFFMQKLSFGR